MTLSVSMTEVTDNKLNQVRLNSLEDDRPVSPGPMIKVASLEKMVEMAVEAFGK